MHNEVDYLDYVRRDLHWFQIIIMEIGTMLYGVTNRLQNTSISLNVTLVCVRFAVHIAIVWLVFFVPEKSFDPKKTRNGVLVLLLVSVAINMGIMCQPGIWNRTSIYWGTFLLQDCTICIFAYIQVIIDYYAWPKFRKNYEIEFYMRGRIMAK